MGRSKIGPDGSNSMAQTHPHLAEEFHPTRNGDLTPENIVAGTRKRLWWQCKTCSHEWEATGDKRSKLGRKCPVCTPYSYAVHSDGRNSLAVMYPDIAEEWHHCENSKRTPQTVRPGSGDLVTWKCRECEHLWKQRVNVRTSQGTGCEACLGKAVHSDGRNSMRNTHPHLVNEFDLVKNAPHTPDSLVAGTNKKLWWTCHKCAYEYRTSGNVRIYEKSTDCSACLNRAIKPDGSNSMVNTHPHLALEFHPQKNHPYTPQNLVAGTMKRIHWECQVCNHEWEQSGNTRITLDTGCPNCAPTGFRPGEPGYYYCMELCGLDGVWWFKGGISHNPERRRMQIEKSLRDSNFPLEVKLIETVLYENGRDAVELELALLKQKSVRVMTSEKFDGSNELFNCNPIKWAKENGFIE